MTEISESPEAWEIETVTLVLGRTERLTEYVAVLPSVTLTERLLKERDSLTSLSRWVTVVVAVPIAESLELALMVIRESGSSTLSFTGVKVRLAEAVVEPWEMVRVCELLTE